MEVQGVNKVDDKTKMTLEMKLNQIKDVNLSVSGREICYNFMVFWVGAKGAKSTEVGKHILYAGNDNEHRYIGPFSIPEGVGIYRRGGGQIIIEPDLLNAFGGSGEFGVADPRVVIELLTKYVGETGRRVKVAMGCHYFGFGYDSQRK